MPEPADSYSCSTYPILIAGCWQREDCFGSAKPTIGLGSPPLFGECDVGSKCGGKLDLDYGNGRRYPNPGTVTRN